jgi:hypothetical protein
MSEDPVLHLTSDDSVFALGKPAFTLEPAEQEVLAVVLTADTGSEKVRVQGLGEKTGKNILDRALIRVATSLLSLAHIRDTAR